MKKYDYDISINYDGDFSLLNMLNKFVKEDKDLWYDIAPYDLFEDIEGDINGESITLTNVDINGEKWEFTITITNAEPSQDFSSYGKWYPTQISITDKIKL